MVKAAVKERYTHGFWNRYFLSNLNTWLALPWTRLFIMMGLRPNHVTWLSFVASICGAVLIAMVPDWWTGPVLGTALMMIGIVWDHSDGQVARATGQGSPFGALLDTILDRWVELAWVAALGIGLMLGNGRLLSLSPEPWLILAATVLATHATLYVRWSNIQKDLYLLRDELRRSQDRDEPGTLRVHTRTLHDGKLTPTTTFYIPFAFNRDATFWMLAVVTLGPDWLLGLLVFGILHSLRGLEKNWYTRGDLKRGDSRAVAALLDPDYHK